jgi:endonuclease/exonuclease/phosphatase (EEP) superfamily protein YafD
MRVVFANLWCLNPCPGRAVNDLLAHDPDLIALAEVAPRGFERIARRLRGHAPVLAVPTDRRCLLTLFSRLPVGSAEVVVEGPCRERPYGRVRLGGSAPCTILFAHTTAPFTARMAARRDAQIRLLAEDAAASEAPTLLLGDLNADHCSRPLRHLTREGRLNCPRQGKRVHATWPAWLPWRTFDHLLHSADWTAAEFRSLRAHGSDHRPLLGEFRLRGGECLPLARPRVLEN